MIGLGGIAEIAPDDSLIDCPQDNWAEQIQGISSMTRYFKMASTMYGENKIEF